MKIIPITATGLALAGSFWTRHREKCSKCQSPPKLFGIKIPLSQAGIGYYSLLLYGVATNKEWASPGLKVAATLHILLMVYMLGTNQVCPACMLTGISALIAAASINPGMQSLTHLTDQL